MGSLRAFRKSVTVNPDLHFDMDMYTNVLGTLVITAYMLSDEKPEIDDIKKQWKKLKKKGLEFWLDDPDFIDKSLNLFNLKAPYGKLAMVQSNLNVLFMPYIDGQVLPVREDGIFPNSYYNGKVYPIEEKGTLKDVE